MNKIQLLDKNLSELIAAGEVVERPSSVVKELLENSIDAKAKAVEIEIKNGGISYIRITDDGSGMNKEDAQSCFMRHATSKIKSKEDLYNIISLGFRGEALASIAAVSKVELITKTSAMPNGITIQNIGGEIVSLEDMGCPSGTTFIIRDLFYNTPARMKFLKKDATEGMYVTSAVQKIALSNPGVSISLIRDGKLIFKTSGNGSVSDVLYTIFGKEISENILSVDYALNNVKVSGYICSPKVCRSNRNMQIFFANSRYIKSAAVTAALEQGYKNNSMIGKFPYAVLFISVDPREIDVNVHPAKTEVKFSDEKAVFEAVYYGVKNALSRLDKSSAAEIIKSSSDNFVKMSAEEYRNEFSETPKQAEISDAAKNVISSIINQKSKDDIIINSFKNENNSIYTGKKINIEKDENESFSLLNFSSNLTEEKSIEEAQKNENSKIKSADLSKSTEKNYRIIGEIFNTYILLETGSSLLLIDKHALHERMLFNSLKELDIKNDMQLLLVPSVLSLSQEELIVVKENLEHFKNAGFAVEEYGDSSVIIREVANVFTKYNYEKIFYETVNELAMNKRLSGVNIPDEILHTIACKGAIKGGYATSEFEREKLIEKIISDDSLKYCPHGRPICVELTRTKLEKMFKRIQN